MSLMSMSSLLLMVDAKIVDWPMQLKLFDRQ
jgi:hypothetical protein